MSEKISVVINTYNEQSNIKQVIDSVKWADEVLVCDMYSMDETVEIAKKLGAKVIYYKNVGYVEPARNFAIKQAKNEWVLILDADEEIQNTLKSELLTIAEMAKGDFVEIPRKNIIFNKWMKASMWWPDYHIRFFKKGSVVWSDKIHSKPQTSGEKVTLEHKEALAITHYHYTSVSQFIERMNRYTSIEANELLDNGYQFKWTDLITKPFNEFLGRFFANRGFEDGLHGLSLSLLQSFSFLVVYLKVWEKGKFEEHKLSLSEINQESKKLGKELDYWFKYSNLSKNAFKRFLQKVGYKFS